MILTKPRLIAQERLDLEDMELLFLGAEADAKFWVKEFWSPTARVMKGFNVSGLGGPSPALITMSEATLINPDNTGSFSWFVGDVGTPPLAVNLTAGTRNYIELELGFESDTPLTRAFWDPSAQGGLGAEFNQTINTVTNLTVSSVALTGGFSGSSNRVPIAIIDTDGGNNIKIILDKRGDFWRLGTPSDPLHNYNWGSRLEPEITLNLTGVSGTFVANEPVSIGVVTAEVQTGGTSTIGVILPSTDGIAAGALVTGGISGATGTLASASSQFTGADKSIDNLKEWIDAVMTEIKGIKGTRFWFDVAPTSIVGVGSIINSAITPFTSTARVKWDGSAIYFLDGAVTPAKADVISKIRLFDQLSELNITRQDDGKEIQTVTFSKVPTKGTFTLNHNGNISNSINWNDSAAQVQTACNATWVAQVTVSGNFSDGFKFIFNTPGPVVAIIVNTNTLKEGQDAVSLTITTLKNGLASIAPIAIADGEVLFVQLPASGNRTYSDAGSGPTNFQVASYGSFVSNDLNYWIAFREGGRLVFRGVGEVGAGDEVDFATGVPRSLLDIIGISSVSSPANYPSNIRGTQSESLVNRLGVLTDAMGDSQEDRSAYLRSDAVVVFDGSQLVLTTDIILEILNTKTGTMTQHTILASNSPIVIADGESVYALIDRDDASETLTLINSGITPIPAQIQGTKDIFVLFRRVDAMGKPYIHIPLHKQLLAKGKTRIGSTAGSSGLELQQNIANNQVVAANITDFLIDSSENKAFKADYSIVRRNSGLASPITENLTFGANIGTAANNYTPAVSYQADGKLLVAGQFTSFNGNTRNRLIRLNANGTEDTAFYTNLGTGVGSGEVWRAIQQPDLKIVVVGLFNTFNGNTRNFIFRLNADGTEDTTFATNTGTGANNTIYWVDLQSDGSIILIGAFTSFNGNSISGLAKLNSDGTFNTTFATNIGTGIATPGATPPYGGVVNPSNDAITVCGNFLSFNGNTRTRILRLNANGTEDTTFATNTGTGADDYIQQVDVDSSNNTFLIGGFTTFNGTSINRIAKLNPNGTFNTTFATNVGTALNIGGEGVLVDSSDAVYFGGDFTSFNGNTRNHAIKLNNNGTEDADFPTALGTGFNSQVFCIAESPFNGSIAMSGDFTTFNGNTRNRLMEFYYPTTGSTQFVEVGSFKGYYSDSDIDWFIVDEEFTVDDAGVVFSIDSSGQVKYTSSNLSGTLVESVAKFVVTKL